MRKVLLFNLPSFKIFPEITELWRAYASEIEDIHVIKNWIFFRLSSLVLASECSSTRKLFVVLLGMTKCVHRTTPHHTALGKIQYRTNGNLPNTAEQTLLNIQNHISRYIITGESFSF